MAAATGRVASRLMVTLSEVVPPPLVAVQVKVWPVVSDVMEAESQPLVELIPDSVSVTFHDRLTSLLYQSLLPSVPLTIGATMGGVMSAVATVSRTVAGALGDWPSWTTNEKA